MMHIEDGDKHSFWADSLPAGLTVVRQFDKFVLAVWIISLIVYAGVCYFLSDSYDGYYLLSFIAVPFAVIGLVYILDRKNLAALIIVIVSCVGVYIFTQAPVYVLVIAYLFVGALGVSCVVDAIQRVIFYRVVGHIRYVNVKERLSLGDKFCSFMFNVPPDLDTRNITISPRKLGNKFPWKEMGSTVMLSLVLGMFIWIYLSMNPLFLSTGTLTGDVPLFIFGLTLYVPVMVLPFSVFKSLDVKIGTNYRDFKLYSGIVATIQRMAIPIFAAFMYVLLRMNEQDPLEVLMFIGFSAIIILFVVFLTSIIYYYAMEATASADISKKWKLFIPVPLLMTLRDESEVKKKEYPGTPVRDEDDMSQLSFSVKK